MATISSRLAGALAGAALLVGLLAGPVAAGGPTTVYVDDDGQTGPNGCNGTSISLAGLQAAVDGAAPGDTIRVCPGTYLEHITITTPDLTIEAVNPFSAIIRNLIIASAGRVTPGGIGSALIAIQGADDVTITGLRLVAPAPHLEGTDPGCRIQAMVAVFGDSDRVRILENQIRAPGPDTLGDCGYSNGVQFTEGSSGTVAGNLIWNFAGIGVDVFGAGTAVRTVGNELRFWHKGEPYTTIPVAGTGSGFSCTYGAGVVYEADATGRIVNNTVPGLDSAGYTTPLICPGIYLTQAGDSILVTGNRVVNAFDAINTDGTNAWTIRDNRFLASRNDGLLVPGSRRGLAEDNVVRGSLRRGIVVESGPPIASAGYAGTGVAGILTAKNNTFTGNTSTHNTGRDCLDPTTGTKTKGTANTWTGNHSDGDDKPNGLCPS